MMEGRKLCFVRVYSGRLKAGADLYNPTLKRKEKVARILLMHANKRDRIEESGAGSIVGVIGLKDASTGDTLCTAEHPVLLEKIESYEPVISIAVEPKTHSDQEKMDEVLAKFTAEDPTLRVRKDEDTGQTILSGMGELHLEIITSRMQREFNTNVNVGKPQVVYREAIAARPRPTPPSTGKSPASGTSPRSPSRSRPLPRGTGSTLRVQGLGRNPARRLRRSRPQRGPGAPSRAARSPATRWWTWRSFWRARSRGKPARELAFTVAASMACKEALSRGAPFLLEPIMTAEVLVPEAFLGEVIGDLNARSGKIESIDHKLGVQVVTVTVPLSRMFGYSTALRSATQGRGTFSMHFSRFDRP